MKSNNKFIDIFNRHENKPLKWLAMFCYAVLLSILINLLLFWMTFMSSKILETSMQPTLNELDGTKSDVVYMSRLKKSVKHIENGDIVIVNHDGTWLVKRVIASKGDTINFKRNKDGAYEVYINGNIIYEDYVKKLDNSHNYNGMIKKDANGTELHPLQRLFEGGDIHFESEIPEGFEYPNYKLEEDEIFIMGDNRLVSISDSRDYGAYDNDDLVGIVKYIKKYEQSEIDFYFDLLFNFKQEYFWK